MDLLSYNSTTNIDDYNCGGFALHCFDWYAPEHYNYGQETIDDMLEDCANDILTDFPELTRVSHYSGVPKELDVIGFRVAVTEFPATYFCPEKNEWIENYDNMEVCGDDFHFILRHKGVWYHKPGDRPIEKCDFHPEDEWPHRTLPYDSDIVWFVRMPA